MHRDRISVPSTIIAMFALCFCLNVLAQVSTMELRVSALDPQNALVPGAAVGVKNLSTGAERKGEMDNRGGYVFVGLPPGRYTISVEAKGFARFVSGEVQLTIGQTADFRAHLRILEGEETVTAIGESELTEIRRTAVAETVSQQEIENLPINGRNYIDFTLTSSGFPRQWRALRFPAWSASRHTDSDCLRSSTRGSEIPKSRSTTTRSPHSLRTAGASIRA